MYNTLMWILVPRMRLQSIKNKSQGSDILASNFWRIRTTPFPRKLFVHQYPLAFLPASQSSSSLYIPCPPRKITITTTTSLPPTTNSSSQDLATTNPAAPSRRCTSQPSSSPSPLSHLPTSAPSTPGPPPASVPAVPS